MKYIYVLPTFCLIGTFSLHANEDKLGDILQNSGEKKVLQKTVEKKNISKKQSRFVFKDTYDANGIGQIEKSASKKRSESYDYENRSRFKFKFNDGYQQSNLVNGYGNGAASSSMDGGYGSSQGAAGGSRHGGGGRR